MSLATSVLMRSNFLLLITSLTNQHHPLPLILIFYLGCQFKFLSSILLVLLLLFHPYKHQVPPSLLLTHLPRLSRVLNWILPFIAPILTASHHSVPQLTFQSFLSPIASLALNPTLTDPNLHPMISCGKVGITKSKQYFFG